ncbi:MAG: hypothetical protein ACO31E_12330 [Phycisphaerales bacterium]
MAKRTKKSKSDPRPVPKPATKSVGRKSAKRATRAPKGGSARAARGGSSKAVSLADLSTATLAAELKRRQSEVPKLERQAAKLRAELAKVEARIASLSAQFGSVASAARAGASKRSSEPSSAKPRARSMRNGQPTIGERLVEILEEAGGVMSPRDLAGVLAPRLGREINQNFLVQISLTLARLVKQGRIVKSGRGQYHAKGASGEASN